MKKSEKLIVSAGAQKTLAGRVPDLPLLFPLKADGFYAVRLLEDGILCRTEKQEITLSYGDVERAETLCEGVVLYLTDGRVLLLAFGEQEKYNIILCDAAYFLSKKLGKRFVRTEALAPPDTEEEEERYQAKDAPYAEIAFTLEERELLRLVRYDYLIEERLWLPLLGVLVFGTACLGTLWALLPTAFFLGVFLYYSYDFFRGCTGYLENHRGELLMRLYEKELVVCLRHTDLVLPYREAKEKRPLFGLWRRGFGKFFTLALPMRVVGENADFFKRLNELSRKKGKKKK